MSAELVGGGVLYLQGGSLKKVHCFEWARGIAAAMVVLLHVMQGIMTNVPVADLGQGRAVVWTVLQLVLTRWAVPVFLMISGSLLLNPSKKTHLHDIWRYERRMLLVLVTFGYLFCLMEQYSASRQVDLTLFGISLLNLLSGKSWSHLWYLYAMMGIYLLLPMFKIFVGGGIQEGSQVHHCRSLHIHGCRAFCEQCFWDRD